MSFGGKATFYVPTITHTGLIAPVNDCLFLLCLFQNSRMWLSLSISQRKGCDKGKRSDIIEP